MKVKISIIISIMYLILCCSGVYAHTGTQRTQFIDADIHININNYTPVISGTISCAEQKNVSINIINKTDNAVIADEVITSADGVHNISYTLPRLVTAKKYDVTIACREGNKTVTQMYVAIDSSILAVKVNGNIVAEDGVELDTILQSTNTGLVDKSSTVTGNKELSLTIPNLVSNASFYLSAKGYKNIEPGPHIHAQAENFGRNVEVLGDISTGQGQQVTILVTDTDENIAYINQLESGKDGNFVIKFELPANAAEGMYRVKLGGTSVNNPTALEFTYAGDTDIPDAPEITAKEIAVTRNDNGIFKIIISADKLKNIAGRVFVVKFDENLIVPVSLCGLEYENSVQTGIHGNMNILSNQNGEIKFKMTGMSVSDNKSWSGLVNVFKFKFVSPSGGKTTISISEEE